MFAGILAFCISGYNKQILFNLYIWYFFKIDACLHFIFFSSHKEENKHMHQNGRQLERGIRSVSSFQGPQIGWLMGGWLAGSEMQCDSQSWLFADLHFALISVNIGEMVNYVLVYFVDTLDGHTGRQTDSRANVVCHWKVSSQSWVHHIK